MHPVCPFITETLWPHVSAARVGDIAGLELPASNIVASAAWPKVDTVLANAAVVADFDRAFALITEIRTLRAKQNVKPKQRIALHAPEPVLELIGMVDGMVETLAGLGEVGDLTARAAVRSMIPFEGSQVEVSGLTDEVDVDAERTRLEAVIEQKSKQVAGFTGKLSNEGYVNGAPPHLVQETRDMLANAEADLAAAQASLDGLK